MHKENLKKEIKKRLEMRCNIIVTIMAAMAALCLVAFCAGIIQFKHAAQNISTVQIAQTNQLTIKKKPITKYFVQFMKDLNAAPDKYKIFRVGHGYIGLHKAARENNLHVRR